MALPVATADQAFCVVSALEGGTMSAPDELFIADAVPGHRSTIPSLCFLLQHNKRPEKMVFDLGIDGDLSKFPPAVREEVGYSDTIFQLQKTPSCIESLSKGGLSPDDIDFVCVSHIHFDHTGDTHAFKASTFLVGGDCKPLFEDAYPKNPSAWFREDLYPADRTRYLPVTEWPPLGPFPHAFDFYGDGSLYIVDSPGHVPGHVNILARTSPDGAWIYLAADSAHHWRIITGESQIRTAKPYGCIHADKNKAEEHIARIRELQQFPRVQVILAHDLPWYTLNKGGDSFWPGKIQPLPLNPL
ncbi:Metallo-hydrolase/oxidoreductase [Pholiota conissans]|uniref:Metallo-hydrolase/oxidoreductase n=1 Tax=Pholiota conissans TaxID=109636 RepID=A0A9P6D4V8_9AGAR|nr:Metallo-hydrolase/oxidoreductase [Pholiota conissans]